jgi:hypothetical protein
MHPRCPAMWAGRRRRTRLEENVGLGHIMCSEGSHYRVLSLQLIVATLFDIATQFRHLTPLTTHDVCSVRHSRLVLVGGGKPGGPSTEAGSFPILPYPSTGADYDVGAAGPTLGAISTTWVVCPAFSEAKA